MSTRTAAPIKKEQAQISAKLLSSPLMLTIPNLRTSNLIHAHPDLVVSDSLPAAASHWVVDFTRLVPHALQHSI